MNFRVFSGENLNQTDLVVWTMSRVNYMDGFATAGETFGQTNETCAVKFSPVEDEFWSYQGVGDIIVRKFPYDPNSIIY